jgi:hypothetical protein
MIEREDFEHLNMDIIISKTMKHSIEKGWQSSGSQILEEKIRRGKTMAFHPSVDDAIQIKYYYRGDPQTSYIHWKDLKIDTNPPKSPPKPVLFDVKNLDI